MIGFSRFIYTDYVAARARGNNPVLNLIFTARIPVTAIFFAACGADAAPPFAGADSFIQRNCAACHNSSAPAARLDLNKLAYDPNTWTTSVPGSKFTIASPRVKCPRRRCRVPRPTRSLSS